MAEEKNKTIKSALDDMEYLTGDAEMMWSNRTQMFDHILIYNIEFLQKCDKNAKNVCKNVNKTSKKLVKV